MSKRLIIALLLIALVAIVLVMTQGSASVFLFFKEIKMATSLAMLAFTAVGVVIGLLLK